MFNQPPPVAVLNEAVYTFIDPAAGGPQSDYCVLSVTRHKGLLTVGSQHCLGLLTSLSQLHKYACLSESTKASCLTLQSLIHPGTISSQRVS